MVALSAGTEGGAIWLGHEIGAKINVGHQWYPTVLRGIGWVNQRKIFGANRENGPYDVLSPAKGQNKVPKPSKSIVIGGKLN